MSCVQVIPAFPVVTRGAPTLLKTDPKRTKLIYGFGTMVIIREANPSAGNTSVQLYSGHSYPVTAVEMATSGCYMASGDKSGVVRIWACDNPEQILKLETPLFGGSVLDLAWSADSQRLLGVGDGSSTYGKVIMWDSGNSVGEISGHMKKINSCSFKSSRPFRLVTGGEDNKVNFYEGPPFKFKSTSKTHQRFVNVVRFSPDGERFFSASSDMYVAVFNGKDAELIVEKKVHDGSIYSAMWSTDSKQILTSSGDGTCKVFDAATLDEVSCLSFKSGDRKKSVEEQQVGCLWTAGGVMSLALGGKMTTYCQPSDSTPSLVQFGHNKPIQCIALKDGKLLASSFVDGTGTVAGQLLSWDLSTSVATAYEGEMHSNMVLAVAPTSTGVVTCGLDDAVGFGANGKIESKLALPAQPKSFSCGSELAAAVTVKDTLVTISVAKKSILAELKLGFAPTCIAVASNDAMCAIGGEDKAVHVLGADGKEMYSLAQHRDSVTCVAFSPKCDKLASGCANKEIVVWSVVDGSILIKGLSGFHTARLSTFAWAPDNATLASGGVDAQIVVWDLSGAGAPKHKIQNAHTAGQVTSLIFSDDSTLISSGMDATIKKWTV